jgi:tRNA-modifying protein YgfZ
VAVRAAGFSCIGLLGPGDAAFHGLGLSRPAGKGAVTACADGAVLAMDGAGERHELWVRDEARETWLQRLRGALQEGCANDWQLALVRAGVAEVRASTRELFLPQMLGYDTDDRVSFRKGCYTGQEIVARTHYKGGVKRHLHRLLGNGTPPSPGSPVERGGTNVGTVVESAAVAGDGCEVLAVIPDEPAAPSGPPLLAGGLEFHLPA